MAKREGELIGNYRLLRLLETNGTFTIYLAEDIVNENIVTIKLSYRLNRGSKEEFLRRAEWLAKLKHRNILPLLNYGIVDEKDHQAHKFSYLVMEHVPNGSFRDRYPEGTQLSIANITSFVKQAASALGFVASFDREKLKYYIQSPLGILVFFDHDEQLRYYILSPNNMLLDRDSKILLTGFDDALFTHWDEQDRDLHTHELHYMAPERFDKSAGMTTQIQYALATIVYEWLCGTLPFADQKKDISNYYSSVRGTLPPSLRSKNPTIPQAIEDVVLKALSKKPEDRFESITAFAEAFERAAIVKVVGSIGEHFGPYSIVRLLGQGDMGKVYFAEDSIQQSNGTWRKQSVAVKVLHDWYDEDIFRNHARKMTKLQHANILSTLLFGMKADAPYLVMQYASQGTLRDRHPRGAILPLETILSYVKQIASALQYAHERDMRGDVRPKKMFVGKDNRILLSGFDITLNVGADPGRMVAKDYFEYRAPEQTQAFLSAACNQYALGVMVYEWLCGNVPFQGESVQIVYQHKKVTPPSLREKNPTIPHEVEEVVMKALAKDPEKRYESIQEFAEALEETILPPKADKFVLPDRLGEQFGKYILVRRLGQGGFAEVYLGQHSTLKKNFVAIKILYAHLSAKQLEGLDTEAQIIAGMQHPSIVRVIDIDIERNIRYLVMDYAPKGTMRQFHARGSRLSLPTVVKYVKQIADALQHAHDQKIIHRDVKPENMLIGANNTIMLSDFGLAMIAHNTKSWKEQDRAGTAKYMAPEQYRRKAIPASDQYSLAVTAYEWLCGAPPFDEGEDDIQLVLQHLQDPIPPMSERGAVVSEEVEKVILKALAKEPAERFGSVKEFADELEKAAIVE